MVSNLVLSLSALVALVPVGLASAQERSERFLLPAILLAVGMAALLVGVRLGQSWSGDFATSIWLTIIACLVEFLLAALWSQRVRRLSGVLAAYLLLLGALGTIWGAAGGRPVPENPATSWLILHIILSVCAYGLITLGAIAGLSVLLQARALKTKRPHRWFARLPALIDGETWQIRFLAAGELVLGLGLATGFASNLMGHGIWFHLDHKFLLSISGFLGLGSLLVWHRIAGLRGRNGARWGLVTYLVVTLAYPGVKFVTDILIG